MDSYTRRDWVWALVVFVAVAAIAVCSIQAGLEDWGDDNAAFVSEGIAIAEGRFDAQARANYASHPAPLPASASDGRLVYPWGYPLMLSAVYRLAGFDRTGYTSILWYKLPGSLCLALLGAVLALFYRRRFSIYASVILALLFCMGAAVTDAVNRLAADLPFLFFGMAALWLMECFARRAPEKRGRVALGAAYALFLFMTHETRQDGLIVCAAALVGHAAALLRARRRPDALHLLPYALFAALVLASERLWLAPATPAALTDAGLLRYYAALVPEYFATLFGLRMPWFGWAATALCLLGIATGGLGKNLHLTLLAAGTFAGLALLDGVRDPAGLFPAMPLLLMYAYQGAAFLARLACRRVDGIRRMELARVAGVLALGLLFLTFSVLFPGIADNLASRGKLARTDVYSANAVEMYRYIQQNLPEDAVICFAKPRMLALNTGRSSFRWGQNGRDVSEAGYYLKYRYNDFGDAAMDQAALKRMKAVKKNRAFVLYRVRN